MITKSERVTKGFLSRFTVEVLARLPKEPGLAVMADLLDDLAADMPVRTGIGKILTALTQIRGRFGLVEGEVDGVAGYGLPATSWEQAQHAASMYLEKHSL
jgi:hypothetical protein